MYLRCLHWPSVIRSSIAKFDKKQPKILADTKLRNYLAITSYFLTTFPSAQIGKNW